MKKRVGLMNDRATYLHTFMHQFPHLYACTHCQPLLTVGEKSFFSSMKVLLTALQGRPRGLESSTWVYGVLSFSVPLQLLPVHAELLIFQQTLLP